MSVVSTLNYAKSGESLAADNCVGDHALNSECHCEIGLCSHKSAVLNLFEIADVTKAREESSVPIVWHGVVRSILNGTHTEAQLTNAINEVFTILPPK